MAMTDVSCLSFSCTT